MVGPAQREATVWALIAGSAAVMFGGSVLFGGGSDGSATDALVIDGLSFPPSMKMAGTQQLVTGGGTRTKYGVAKVYAVALYLDESGGKSALSKFATGSAPTKNAKFYKALIDGPFARTLHLQFHRSVASDAMVTALDEAMSKRLPADALAKFRAAFLKALPAGNLAKGANVYFMCKGNTMAIGEGSPSAASTLTTKGVCTALFDVYFGKSPVSVPAKEGVAAGFAKRGFYLAALK